MPDLDVILAGAADALALANVLFVVAGVATGILVGAIPGLNGPMAIAIAIPATFWLPPLPAIGFLIGIMKGSTVGGAIPAILMNTPGTPDSALTALDGYPLAQKGKSGKALKMGLYASITGDTMSDVVLFTVAAPLSLVALMLGPVEQAALIFFSVCVVAGLIGGNPFRGLAAAAAGFVLAAVGQAPEEATPRLTFGFAEIEAGLPLVSVGIGVLVLGEIIFALAHRRGAAAGALAPRPDADGRRLLLRSTCRPAGRSSAPPPSARSSARSPASAPLSPRRSDIRPPAAPPGPPRRSAGERRKGSPRPRPRTAPSPAPT